MADRRKRIRFTVDQLWDAYKGAGGCGWDEKALRAVAMMGYRAGLRAGAHRPTQRTYHHCGQESCREHDSDGTCCCSCPLCSPDAPIRTEYPR